MNLFTISGISVRYDDTPESNPIQLTTSEFELAFTGDVFNYSVLGLTDPDALLPEITLNNESGLTVARLNGVDLTGDAGEPFELTLGFVNTPSGTLIILGLFDEASDTDYIFQIGGDDSASLPTTLAGFAALEGSITGGGPITFGEFAPNQNIPLSEFENTAVSDLPDGQLFTGTNGNDNLLGGIGNDTLDGRNGDDTLDGAGGNDTLIGGNGNDVLIGGAGNDVIRTGENDPYFGDQVTGGSGSDTVDFSGLQDGFVSLQYIGLASPITATINGVLNTGSVNKGPLGTDTLIDVENPMIAGFNDGGLRVSGTTGNDLFTVVTDANQWISLRTNGGSDTFDLSGAGLVQLDFRGPAVTADLVAGTITQSGNTSTVNGTIWELRTSNDADSIIGTAADESFRVAGGNDTVDGGGGFDRLRYDDFGVTTINGNLALGIVTGTAGGFNFTDAVANIEWLRGSEGNDTLVGNSAANRLQGDDGNDRLLGGLGNDTIEGGSGTDTAVLAIARTQAQVSTVNGMIQIISSEGTDKFSSIEVFEFSDGSVSAANLIATGGVPGEVIVGTDGDDTLIGTINDDTLAGGAGNDSIESGGGGNNNISGSDGNDTLLGGPGADSVGGGLGDDTVFGNDGDDVIGAGFGNDFVSGGNGDDVVAGGAGNDTLEGGEGDDNMSGSFGNDLIFGNGGNDDIGGGTGRDTIDAGAGNDSVGGGEGDDSILGGSGNDFLAGGGRNDVINGGVGNDQINAGKDDDTITGGAGDDTFIFTEFTSGERDTITDWTNGEDLFRLTGITNAPGSGLQGRVDALDITAVAGGVEFGVDDHTVFLQGASVGDLGLEDFIFV